MGMDEKYVGSGEIEAGKWFKAALEVVCVKWVAVRIPHPWSLTVPPSFGPQLEQLHCLSLSPFPCLCSWLSLPVLDLKVMAMALSLPSGAQGPCWSSRKDTRTPRMAAAKSKAFSDHGGPTPQTTGEYRVPERAHTATWSNLTLTERDKSRLSSLTLSLLSSHPASPFLSFSQVWPNPLLTRWDVLGEEVLNHHLFLALFGGFPVAKGIEVTCYLLLLLQNTLRKGRKAFFIRTENIYFHSFQLFNLMNISKTADFLSDWNGFKVQNSSHSLLVTVMVDQLNLQTTQCIGSPGLDSIPETPWLSSLENHSTHLDLFLLVKQGIWQAYKAEYRRS